MSEPPLTTSDPETELLEAAVEAPAEAPRVGILTGSTTDLLVLEEAGAVLTEHHVAWELRVASPHEEPETVAAYCRNARMRGLRVLIAGGTLSAALPGIAAAHTDLPVIGVPLSGLGSVSGGLDAVLGTVQAPPGAPVAAVGLDNARNAALLAIRILASGDPSAPVR